jgi:crotonobetainyl-CoA:carnitine CoA-transferase CaiB-like acyl-CoA transferase
MGGEGGAVTNRALVEWMDSEGMADDFIKQTDWDTFDMANATQEIHDRFEECFGKFFKAHTKAELYEGAIERHIMLYPVSTPKDIVESPQLAARDFWQRVEHPELNDAISYPGAFAKSSEVSFGIRRRAPLIGEHNEEIYEQEMGLTKDEIAILKQAKVI